MDAILSTPDAVALATAAAGVFSSATVAGIVAGLVAMVTRVRK